MIAVNDVDLEITDKEFIVLVGPSGCGKSTLLRCIAGLEDITAGELYIADRLVNHVPPKDRDIAMVFQSYALYPHMTAYRNMAFGLENRKLPKEEIKSRVMEAAKILDIESLLERKPKAMSGGQRQRVALGRAMVREPAVFLLDEPLSNLDAKLRTSMRTELIKLHKRLATTFIYVTHDQIEAMTMGDRIVVMKDGVVQQIGTPQQLYDHPCNRFVAGFIGTPQMNFLDAIIRKDQQGWYLELIGNKQHSIRLDKSLKELNKYLDCPVTLGIRPEHISLVADSEISAQVDVLENLGSESFLYLNCVDSQIVVKTSGACKVAPEACVSLEFQRSKIHLFEKETETALI